MSAGLAASIDLPYVEVCSPSTTSAREDGKISGRPKGRRAQWRVAPPLPGAALYGRNAEVRVELIPRISAEVWIEVRYIHGRFWIRHDASVLDLMFRIQQGGFKVAPPVAAKPSRGARPRA